MISSYPRRALLALAVITFVFARASAQTESDDAFSSALSQGAPAPAQFSALKAKPQKPAAPAAPSAPEAVWQKVLEAVRNDGTYEPGTGPMPGMFSIEDSTGDPKGAHVKHAITILGMINDDGQFEAMGAVIVFAESKLNAKDGNYHVEQWMFQTDIYGDVEQAGHGVILMSPDGKPLGSKRSELKPADPKIQKQYDAMLKHWAERTPKGA